MDTLERQCDQKATLDDNMEAIHDHETTSWTGKKRKWIVGAKAWYSEYDFVPKDNVKKVFKNMMASQRTITWEQMKTGKELMGTQTSILVKGNKNDGLADLGDILAPGPFYINPREGITFTETPSVPTAEDKERMSELREKSGPSKWERLPHYQE